MRDTDGRSKIGAHDFSFTLIGATTLQIMNRRCEDFVTRHQPRDLSIRTLL